MSDSREKTLLFIINCDQVLLGLKKRGFGAGRWNGFGGGLEPGEAPIDAALREILEEAGVSLEPAELDDRGYIDFSFVEHPPWDQGVHLFSAQAWSGDPLETEEMQPRWWSTDALDYDEMWIDDRYWLPKFFEGERIEASFVFGGTGEGAWIERMHFTSPEGYAPSLRPEDGRPRRDR